MTEENTALSLRVHAQMRRRNSGDDPILLTAGGNQPMCIITFDPNLKDEPDTILCHLDTTGFEPLELAAMLSALSETVLDGIRAGEVIESKTKPADWDFNKPDYGDADPDGGGK